MQAAFQTRCSPIFFQSACSKLTETKKEVVAEMGFGGLLHMDLPPLSRQLCLELVNCLDMTRHMLCVKGRMYPISYRDVGVVFGLPDSGMEQDLLFIIKCIIYDTYELRII